MATKSIYKNVTISTEKSGCLLADALEKRGIKLFLYFTGDGPFRATAWGCDLTYDYVKINGDYRT